MFDRVELIKALNSILELMFDEFCQVCSRLAIYKKMKKNLCQLNLTLKDISFSSSTNRSYHQIVFIIKSFSSSNCSHHQIVLIIKSFSSSSRLHQVVFIKSFASSRSHHQTMLIIKSFYQVILSSHIIKQS